MEAFFKDLYYNIQNIFHTVQWTDILDILLVAFLAYKLIQLVRETRAAQLVKGILLLTLSYLIAAQLNLKTMSFILVNIFSIGIMAILIVFQPELRRALEQVGRTKISRFNIFGGASDRTKGIQDLKGLIDIIGNAAVALSKTKTGALIVIERETKLGDIIKSGTIVNASPSVELICNIFYPKSPLHDGAMVVRDFRLYAAGCFLPLMQRMDNHENYGTRHRAAIGMSENSDSLVVVVSEESGTISLAKDGRLVRGFSGESLKEALFTNLRPSQVPTAEKQAEKKLKE